MVNVLSNFPKTKFLTLPKVVLYFLKCCVCKGCVALCPFDPGSLSPTGVASHRSAVIAPTTISVPWHPAAGLKSWSSGHVRMQHPVQLSLPRTGSIELLPHCYDRFLLSVAVTGALLGAQLSGFITRAILLTSILICYVSRL